MVWPGGAGSERAFKAHLSSSTVARLKEKWQAEWEVWQSRPLNDLEVVYLWVDGIYVKAGLEKEKAVLLVVLAALSDGSKAVVSVTSGFGNRLRAGRKYCAT